jgi:hypothetical protein
MEIIINPYFPDTFLNLLSISGVRGIFIFGGGNKRLRNVTKMYCQCQISHKRRKKEYLGKFKLSML